MLLLLLLLLLMLLMLVLHIVVAKTHKSAKTHCAMHTRRDKDKHADNLLDLSVVDLGLMAMLFRESSAGSHGGKLMVSALSSSSQS